MAQYAPYVAWQDLSSSLEAAIARYVPLEDEYFCAPFHGLQLDAEQQKGKGRWSVSWEDWTNFTDDQDLEDSLAGSQHEFRHYGFYAPMVPNPYMSGARVRKVPRHRLGSHVLGRCFPAYGLIEIANDLLGNDFEEVLAHELMHLRHPEKPEYEIRQLTRMALPFAPRFH
ncbi:MAG: hypothetical protein HY519_03705 [Candidatus Aenigmarchaeota archaeon]|nr:hypothetical protein [Candidatus Aenigmarchaeota archaeon]